MYPEGRFVEAQAQRLLGNLISIMPSVDIPTDGMTVNFDEVTAQKVRSWAVRLWGHKLHRFGENLIPELDKEETLKFDEVILKVGQSELGVAVGPGVGAGLNTTEASKGKNSWRLGGAASPMWLVQDL